MSATAAQSRPLRNRAVLIRVLTDAGLVLGGALAIAALISIAGDHSGLGFDTPSYWLAGRHVIEGTPLYQRDPYSTLALYTSPPIFAQLFVPAALLPELLIAWLSRLTGVLCLRYIVGSWKATVIACAFVPVLTELSITNVTLQLAACLMFALKDRRGAYLLPWAVALKFGPVLIVPYLWFRKPETRRPLLVGTLIFLGACLVSGLVAPRAWSDYVDVLRFQNMTDLFALAGAVALFAAYTSRDWLAYAAASITCPVLAFSRFAPLVGLWRFRRKGESDAPADVPAASRAMLGDPALGETAP